MPDPTTPATKLTEEKSADADAVTLTAELARKLKIANDHRVNLFNFVLCIVGASLLIVTVIVTLVGIKQLTLATPVLVAFIAALAVQSFVLIGFLARGLFIEKGAPAAAPPEVD
ncbi:hypothetical protein MicroSTF_12465 [Microbacterium sp. STF-2]|jgi:hypothetical protein|uniref:hypothetical protein n=1 Tax=Microbacterium sp. STF-2 TaxID=3031132 RepID=UPI002AFE4F7B|nr:hypothetical protein [Microbacterium sp. STF-2]MEA1263846.1 hypothetical protein [Microbacterium sp. STF-2]